MIQNRIKLLDQCNNSYHRSIKKKPINPVVPLGLKTMS